jgi:hypothetical protein
MFIAGVELRHVEIPSVPAEKQDDVAPKSRPGERRFGAA